MNLFLEGFLEFFDGSYKGSDLLGNRADLARHGSGLFLVILDLVGQNIADRFEGRSFAGIVVPRSFHHFVQLGW